MGHKQNMEKTGSGRITREQMKKWNQMTALRFQTLGGGASETPGLPSGLVWRDCGESEVD